MGALLARLWALPVTLAGVALAALALLCGARVRLRHGCVECTGGELGQIVAALPPPVAFVAVTLGHVILAASDDVLERVRAHEHAHVRQYERWGALLLPAYLLAGAFEALRGRAPYRDNWFERDARAREQLTRGEGVA